MHIQRIVGLVLICLLTVGCASTTVRVAPATPDDAVADGSDTGQPEPAQPDDSAAAPSDRPADVTLNFAYPDGWTAQADPERNVMVVSHPSGSTITFGIWPLEQGSPFEQIVAIWTSLADSAERGAPVEAGSPASGTFEGVETSYLIATATANSGTRLTLMWVAFTSNFPGVGIMVQGIWPESMNEEMMDALQAIARSIRIGEPSPGQPVPAPAPETK